VDAGQHPPQPVASVGGEELEPLRVVSATELRERRGERLGAEHRRLSLLELAEARIEAGGERICLEQARAEAVDRRDPGSVELTREVVPPALGERRADSGAELSRGAARVCDHEDRVDVEA